MAGTRPAKGYYDGGEESLGGQFYSRRSAKNSLTGAKKPSLSGWVRRFSPSFSNSRSSSCCRLLRLTGVSTTASMNMSPRAADRSTVIPFDRRRNWCPDCVPAGTVTRVRLPSTVGTSIVPPRAAVVIGSGTRQWMLAPSRWKIRWGVTLMKMKRSPAEAPRMPTSPSPPRRMRMPSSPPAVASRAGYRLGPSLGAGPVALLAGDQVRHPDRRLLAAEGLLERNLEVVAQVVAAARPALAAPSAHELAHRLVRRRHGRSDHRRRAFDRP